MRGERSGRGRRERREERGFEGGGKVIIDDRIRISRARMVRGRGLAGATALRGCGVLARALWDGRRRALEGRCAGGRPGLAALTRSVPE